MLLAPALLTLAQLPLSAPAIGAARRTRTPVTGTSRPASPKARILLLGDSLMATDLGGQLEQLLRTPHTAVLRVARSATGMSRPDVLDWVAVARTEVARFRPHLVIVLIGANDGQDLALVQAKRHRRVRRIHWKTSQWARAYRARLNALLGALGALGSAATAQSSAAGSQSSAPSEGTRPVVLWLGLPPVRSSSLERKLVLIRALQRRAMVPLGDRGQYVGLLPFVRTLLDQAPRNRHGRIRKGWLRKRDGVHFSFRGARRMARALLPVLLPWMARSLVSAALDAARAPPADSNPAAMGVPSAAARPPGERAIHR